MISKTALKILTVILIAAVILFGIRFILGGPEDSWICVNGEWVKHGMPNAPMPTEECE